MTRIAIDDIRIGSRIREDHGDIDGMAESLEKYGQIEPVVIAGEDSALICGERRLLAAKALGWEEIEAAVLWDLSPEQRREIEFEENLQRKDLTPHEASKRLVAKARKVATGISAQSAEKAPQGRGATYDAPKADIAQALGVSTGAIVKAEQHVAAVERYPELEPLPQSTAIDTAKTLDILPEPEREQVRAVLVDATPDERRKVAREQVQPVDLSAAINMVDPQGYDNHRLRMAWSDMAHRIQRNLLPLNVERLAEVLDDGAWTSLEQTEANVTAWFARVKAARGRGLRIVGGSQ